MIHYGKTPDGELNMRVSADDVGEFYVLLESAGLLQRRTFNGLKVYLCEKFSDELEAYRRRMTAQRPAKSE